MSDRVRSPSADIPPRTAPLVSDAGSGATPLAETLGIATQVARGLAAAHLRGVVHCDVKPENVFIASDGHVKILDFGVARLLAGAGEVSSAISQERTSNARAFAGTPAY